MKVKNADIAGLHRRVQIFRNELDKSVSAVTASFRDPDVKRLNAYLDALKSYKKWVMSQDPLDAPHWHAKEIDVPELAPVPDSENAEIVDVCRMVELLDVELVKSQSKDLPSGLTPHDSNRFDANITRLEAYVSDYIKDATPLDLPEAAGDEIKKSD